MADPRLKTLKIKSGIVKRITREKVMYISEAEKQTQKVQQMKDKVEDEYNIRKQEEVLQEARMMVPECQRRLMKAYEDLKNLLNTEVELSETEEYKTAKDLLKAAETQIEAN